MKHLPGSSKKCDTIPFCIEKFIELGSFFICSSISMILCLKEIRLLKTFLVITFTEQTQSNIFLNNFRERIGDSAFSWSCYWYSEEKNVSSLEKCCQFLIFSIIQMYLLVASFQILWIMPRNNSLYALCV